MYMAMQDDTAKYRDAEEQNTLARSNMLGLQYFDSREITPDTSLYPGLLSIPEMYSGHIVPLTDNGENTTLVFGITINTPQQLLRQIREHFEGRNVQFVVMSNSGYKGLMLRYDPPKKVVYNDVKIATEGDSATIDEVSKTLESVRPDDVLDYLIKQADRLNASDIHLEVQRDSVRVRLRVDGALHPVANLTKDKYRILFASIASRANISTAAGDAQTGHMQQDVVEADGAPRLLNMRIETVPTVYGQDAVIRLFNFDANLLRLDSLGMTNKQQKNFEEIVEHPHGMVLMVGPTGSGKSTMLYSIINALNDPGRKILTLEDPVEFSIPGISQIPVNTQAGDSFADKLRTVLRLDPDVVMVGEIRDIDTAKTAIQAAITGHLVLSTFHASTAATAFSRMIDMIGQNPIFSTAIRLVVGQRLVRRLDDATKIPYTPDEATKKYIRQQLQSLPQSIPMPDIDNLTLYRPGKSDTVPFGYLGRMAIIEQMVVDEKIQGFLRGDVKDVNAHAIEETARQNGMVSLMQDGILKAIAGQTTLEEINRVI
jgi:type II secretory ATPase GspE/PulE/Tfp pilus assembly ATPase PilB-like protein